MPKPNFFVGIDALNCLLQTDFEKPTRDIDLTLDFIELPLWFSFQSDEKTQTLKVYTQTELYNKDESMAIEQGSLVVDRASGQATFKGPQGLDKNIGLFYVACQKLSCLIQENDLEPLYAELDPDEAGILLTEDNGELSWKVVSGRARPSLTVQTLFGGTTMGRPYMDDFWERSALDDLSMEEKIEAAEAGNFTAMEELAMLYLNGDEDQGIDPDPKKCVYWLSKAAEAGDSTAMFNLGLHYAKGHGVQRDFEKAVEWMQKAADAGDDDAPRLVEEYRKLVDALEKAEKGDAQAQADLAGGLMKLGGSLEQAGAGNDYTESFQWAKKAADQGNTDAMWTLALAYEHGRGVDENVDSAIDYYRQGAELGNAACQHSLGCYYARGDYLKKDNKKAFELFRKSAEQGYGLAMKDLGRCYQFGAGCMGNMKTALEWYTKASEVLDDPELDERVVAFQSLANIDPHWDEDYPGEDDLNEEDDSFAGVSDATEIMRKNLKAAGKDASDEALANMSVEEAYAAFSGIFDDDDEEQKAAEPKQTAEERARKEKEAAEKKAAEEKARREREEARRIQEEQKLKFNEEMMQIRSERIKYLKYARGLIGASIDGFAYVKPDGTVISHSDYYNIGGKGAPGDTSRFKNIKSVVCTQDGIVGLKYNGTCIATEPGFTYAHISECNSWKDIIAIAAGAHQVVGLKKDGTCVANSISWNTGYGYDGQSDVSGWSNIVAIACCDNYSMGLKADGTVTLACTSEYCKIREVRKWTNIEMIAAGYNSAVALTKDGKIVSAGTVSTSGIDPKKGIVQLAIANGQAYALYVDGTVGGGEKRARISEENVISLITSLRALYVLTEDGRVHSYSNMYSKVPKDIRIFDSYNQVMDDRIKERERKRKEAEENEKKRAEEEKLHAERMSRGVCKYCGGTFKKGLFGTKCISCGKKKDY